MALAPSCEHTYLQQQIEVVLCLSLRPAPAKRKRGSWVNRRQQLCQLDEQFFLAKQEVTL